ncbi:MAG: transposase domain-containing protein [Anaerolineales bacterium]
METQFCNALTFDTVNRVVPPEVIDGVVRETGRKEVRARKLTARLTVWGLLGMCLYSQLSMGAVLQKLAKGLRLLWPDWT